MTEWKIAEYWSEEKWNHAYKLFLIMNLNCMLIMISGPMTALILILKCLFLGFIKILINELF